MDLSRYFDTLNHERLLNLLRQNIKDERVIQMIKRYLKSGAMENGAVMRIRFATGREFVITVSEHISE